MPPATLCQPAAQIAAETDDALLRRFASQADQAALAELIDRYAPVIYAAARRRIHDPGLAEDVAQCVFVTLARRAAKVSGGGVLPAWLLQTTRFTVANAMKTASRRRLHEQAAAAIPRPAPDDPADLAAAADAHEHWQSVRPLLDDALSRLGRAEQSAVVLRYFRGLALRQVAQELGTTEEAARKRVSRALRHLRKYLTAAGAAPQACAELSLAALLTHGTINPPAHFTAHAVAAASAAIPTGPTVGGLPMPLLTKLAISIAVAGLITAGGIKLILSTDAPAPAGPDTPPQAAAPDGTDWHTRFNQVYALGDGENLKNIPPLFIPERNLFFQEINPQAAAANAGNKPNQFMIDQQPNGKFRLRSYGSVASSDGDAVPATAILARLTRLQPNQIAGDDLLLQTLFRGDWIVRANANTEQIMHGMALAIGEKRHKTVTVKRTFVDQDVIVVHGQLRTPKDPNADQTIHISLAPDANSRSGGVGSINQILRTLGDATGLKFVNETSSPDGRRGTYTYDISVPDNFTPPTGDQLNTLLKSLHDQTGLTFQPDTRPFDTWTLTEEKKN